MAGLGRESHPNNQQLLPKRPQTELAWEALGLGEMRSQSEGKARGNRGPSEGKGSEYGV